MAAKRRTRSDGGGAARGLAAVESWFEQQGWTPYPFQRRAWRAYAKGQGGLIHVPTGAGKTYAAYGGPLAELINLARSGAASTGVRVVYVTPLRAVSRDIALAIRRPLADLGLLANNAREERTPGKLTVESRTGDTSQSVRTRQRERLPSVLITTPESLTLLLTRPGAAESFASLSCLVLDEWHELLSSKRGTQCELAAARLRRFAPRLRTWALSATIANVEEAAQAAVGVGTRPTLISARMDRPVVIESLLPRKGDPFPWAGHLGLSMLPRVVEALDPDRSTLIFVNTRSQSEYWYNALAATKPEWFGLMGLHHGSVDREERERVEAGLKDGSVRLVVATSSLDLGVDFAPVERVFQIGSPKGVARLVQRAGRASHRPGEPCHITCVPTHALEVLEVAAVRDAFKEGHIEARKPESKPLDALVQHLVTVALGGGFEAEELLAELRTAYAYRDLTKEELGWALDLAEHGGETLRNYREYHRIQPDEHGRFGVQDAKLARLHRLNVGTITGDATMDIRYVSGKRLGSIEERFIGNLRKGEKFFFAGKVVEFVRTKDLTALVRPSKGQTRLTPIWGGTRLPISESLSEGVRRMLQAARDAKRAGPELRAFAPFVGVQQRTSRVPDADSTLIELTETRDGTHLFVFPFEGRLVHSGLGAVLALRLSRIEPGTFTISANDYGVELLTEKGYDFAPLLTPDLFTPEGLAGDAIESVNLSLLAKQQFREIARVSGLVFQTYPGAPRSARQMQARAGLIYDVFAEFDPENLLLRQARREVMEKQFEQSRLARTMSRLSDGPLEIVRTERPTPLSLPLVIERVGAKVSTQSLLQRIDRIKAAWGA